MSVDAAGASAEHFAFPSHRCGECHGDIESSWRPSAHARAVTTPLFTKMRDAAGHGADCDGCHAPLRAKIPADDPAAADGVGCDSCHLMTDMTPRREGKGFTLRVDDTTRYGPLCDAQNHYFHKMGCSPGHAQSKQCASCHLLYGAGAIPLFTEYEEWERSRYASSHECQDCHMASRQAALAVGAKGTRRLARHDFALDEMSGDAIKVTLGVETQGDELAAVVTMLNEGAGHSVPTGLPEHRLVLAVSRSDASGANVQRWERVYGRVLVDGDGKPAPFYRAARVESDTRIGVDESRVERFTFPKGKSGRIDVSLTWLRVPQAMARELGVPEDSRSLASGGQSFDSARLPKPLRLRTEPEKAIRVNATADGGAPH